MATGVVRHDRDDNPLDESASLGQIQSQARESFQRFRLQIQAGTRICRQAQFPVRVEKDQEDRYVIAPEA